MREDLLDLMGLPASLLMKVTQPLRHYPLDSTGYTIKGLLLMTVAGQVYRSEIEIPREGGNNHDRYCEALQAGIRQIYQCIHKTFPEEFKEMNEPQLGQYRVEKLRNLHKEFVAVYPASPHYKDIGLWVSGPSGTIMVALTASEARKIAQGLIVSAERLDYPNAVAGPPAVTKTVTTTTVTTERM